MSYAERYFLVEKLNQTYSDLLGLFKVDNGLKVKEKMGTVPDFFKWELWRGFLW